MDNSVLKIKYLHGRPGAHYTHANFAKQVGADFEFIDFKYRWQDQDKGFFYVTRSWFYCARNYTDRKKYNIFLIDNLHFPPVIMKWLYLKKKRQKIVVYLGSHTMYYLYARKFSWLNLLAHRIALKSYDAIICEGEMARFFVKDVLKKKAPPVYTVFNGIPESQNLSGVKGKSVADGKKLLFIGSYNNAFRFEYKGVDIMLEAFDKAYQQDPELSFTLVGHPFEERLQPCLDKMQPEARKAVTILDYTTNLEDLIFDHHIYLHCSRGDAFPTTVLIALSAGMPTIVNELNGTREAVAKVDPQLVASQDPANIADKIIWYTRLSDAEKTGIRDAARNVSEQYTEDQAVKRFKEAFEEVKQDLFPAN